MGPLSIRRCVITGFAVLLLAMAGTAGAARSFITIATGDVTGVYYQAGGGVCSLVNAGRTDHQIRCTVASSPGSVANIRALRRGERALAFAQSDLVQQAYRGSGVFSDTGRVRGLRTVLALHPETITVVARADSEIETVQDLRGKRVNVGPEGSGQWASMQSLMNALGWTTNDFSEATRMNASEQVDAFCSDRLDAAVFVTGHPNNAVQQALSCDGDLVPVQGPAINRLVRSAPFYSTSVIPGGVYSGVSDEIPTYGVTSLLISSTNTAREIVFEVAKAVFEQPARFREWHRALNDLEPAGMARGARVVEVPLHPGAEMFYKSEDLL